LAIFGDKVLLMASSTRVYVSCLFIRKVFYCYFLWNLGYKKK